MRLVSRIVSRVRVVHAHRYLVVVGAALLFAQSSRAQSLPAHDAAPEAESQAATQAATQPTPQPALPDAGASSTPAAVNAARDPGLQIPWFSLGACAASAGLGVGACALVAPAAAVILLGGNPRVGPIPTISLVALIVALGAWIGALTNVVLAPFAVGICAVLDSPPGQDWWPRLAGAAAGCLPTVALVGIAALAIVSQLATGYSLPPPTPSSFLSLALMGASSASMCALWFSPLVAPVALGGVLLADLLFQPKPATPASAPAMVSEE